MTVKVICEICGDMDDWTMDGVTFFPAGARGEILPESGANNPLMKWDICQSCLEQHLLPLFKTVPDSVANEHPNFVSNQNQHKDDPQRS